MQHSNNQLIPRNYTEQFKGKTKKTRLVLFVLVVTIIILFTTNVHDFKLDLNELLSTSVQRQIFALTQCRAIFYLGGVENITIWAVKLKTY